MRIPGSSQRLRSGRWVRLLLAGVVGYGASVHALQDRPIFRSTTEIVRVQVAVFATDGGPVVDLDPTDFTVFEDGEERPITVFFGPEQAPLEVAIAMDTSASMAGWPSRDLFHALLDQLHPDSCVLLIPFEERVGDGIWGRPADQRIREAIDETPQVGHSEAVFDSLVAAFSALRGREVNAATGPVDFGVLLRFRAPNARVASAPATVGSCSVPARDEKAEARRAVVVVTDEADSASATALEDVLLASWGSGIPVFALSLRTLDPIRPPGTPRSRVHERLLRRTAAASPQGSMETLAKYTGGVVLKGTKGRYDKYRGRYVFSLENGRHSAIQDMERLGQALRGHYVLGYVPPAESRGDAELIVESALEVRVARDDVDALTLSALARGQGMSEGAALDLALRGFRELAAELLETALGTFDSAVLLGPELGLAHYGRAVALANLDRHPESLRSFETAKEKAPWLPDLHARLAVAQFRVGDFDAAWHHALRAFYRGAEIGGLIEDLQRVAPRIVDLSKPPRDPRVAVVLHGGGGIAAALVSPRIFAMLVNLASSSESMRLDMSPDSSDLVLNVRITDGGMNGPRVSVRGQLVLEDRHGREWASERFRIHDARNADIVAEDLVPAFLKIEDAVRAIHERG